MRERKLPFHDTRGSHTTGLFRLTAEDASKIEFFDLIALMDSLISPAKKYEILLRLFAKHIGGVDLPTLHAARARILTLPAMPTRQTLTEVIDGQLALREIAGTDDADAGPEALRPPRRE